MSSYRILPRLEGYLDNLRKAVSDLYPHMRGSINALIITYMPKRGLSLQVPSMQVPSMRSHQPRRGLLVGLGLLLAAVQDFWC